MLSVPQFTSCVDEERDLSAWLGNNLQHQAFDALCSLQRLVSVVDDAQILQVWNSFQSCENFYYMSTKFFNHSSSITPYQTPYEAFINYMNVLSDFTERLNNIPLATQFETYTKEELDAVIAKHAYILKELEEVKKKQEEKMVTKTVSKKTSAKPTTKADSAKKTVKAEEKKTKAAETKKVTKKK